MIHIITPTYAYAGVYCVELLIWLAHSHLSPLSKKIRNLWTLISMRKEKFEWRTKRKTSQRLLKPWWKKLSPSRSKFVVYPCRTFYLQPNSIEKYGNIDAHIFNRAWNSHTSKRIKIMEKYSLFVGCVAGKNISWNRSQQTIFPNDLLKSQIPSISTQYVYYEEKRIYLHWNIQRVFSRCFEAH